MKTLLQSIFPPTHRHPAKHLHEFSQPFDPMTSELQPNEHGCSEAREMKLVLNFQSTGHTRITIN